LGTRAQDVRTVLEVLHTDNSHITSPENRYTIAPEELIAAQRQSREQGLEIVGFYHSHPDHAPQWSATDLDEAHWGGCSYVITSVEKEIAEMTKSFVLRVVGSEKRFEEEAIQIEYE
jgi:proteasome lid subunit RPN8/RPN11